MRLATKILLAFGLLLLTTLFALVFFTGRAAIREMRGAISQIGMMPNSLLARELAAYYQGHNSWEGVESVLSSPKPMGSMHNTRLMLIDVGGTVVADTAGTMVGKPFAPSPDVLVIPITVEEKQVGQLASFENPQKGPEEPLVGAVNRALLLAAITAGVVGLAIALLLSQSLTSPLRQLTDATQRFARGERNLRLPARSRDEVGDLTHSFQAMMSEIERQEKLRKEMSADIAHELRTPLSVVRANLDALADGVYPMTRENLAPIRESIDLLDRLVEDLRTLDLVDAGRLTLEKSDVDIPRLINRVAALFSPQAESRSRRMEVAVGESIPMLKADAQRLEQILGNLVENALRHTPGGGYIRLSAGAEAGAVLMAVEDSGPGIPPGQLERIFERFYRLDEARTRAEGGSGLGLAIARKLAEAHGGSLWAENRPEGGSRFVLRLPLEWALRPDGENMPPPRSSSRV
jgi:two-component system sensor histidine kinase BaeS